MGSSNSACPVPAGAEDYGDRGSSWKPMLYGAFACTCVTTVISLSLIYMHLRRYRLPKQQRQIIRIAFSVVIYSVVAWFEILSYEKAQYIDPIGDVYEAFGLCALFLLFIYYAAPTGVFDDDTLSAVKAAEEHETDFDWPRISWIFVFQYPIFELLAVAIEEATEATGTYCVNSLKPRFAHLWIEIITSMSIGVCVLSIWRFRRHTSALMKEKRGLAKLACFKVIVFIRFAQAWAFSALLEYDIVKTSSTFSYNDIVYGIPGCATCAEMVIASLGFWYAFSSTEYSSSAKPQDKPLPLGRAILDALNPWDLVHGLYRIFPLSLEMHRTGDWKRWRIAMKQTGIQGLVRRGIKKYKDRKNAKSAKVDGRYPEYNESTEPMNRPTQSYRDRAESQATQGSGNDFYPMTGLSGQHIYQPPTGSPPDETGADSRLMSESMPDQASYPPAPDFWQGRRYDRMQLPAIPHEGVPTDTSQLSAPLQGQWNRQRYDRTPSAAAPHEEAPAQGRDMI